MELVEVVKSDFTSGFKRIYTSLKTIVHFLHWYDMSFVLDAFTKYIYCNNNARKHKTFICTQFSKDANMLFPFNIYLTAAKFEGQ